VKRGDWLIVAGASGDIEVSDGQAGAVRYYVKHILYKEQVRHLKQKGMWPACFADDGEAEAQEQRPPAESTTSGITFQNFDLPDSDSEDSDVDHDADLFVNPNHVHASAMLPSDDEEDEDEDEDEDE